MLPQSQTLNRAAQARVKAAKAREDASEEASNRLQSRRPHEEMNIKPELAQIVVAESTPLLMQT